MTAGLGEDEVRTVHKTTPKQGSTDLACLLPFISQHSSASGVNILKTNTLTVQILPDLYGEGQHGGELDFSA